ncbi:SPOR domain-containing protein [Thermomonas sp. HDW16]|uniref:SPOR domain-containing protein n=1 Tax=Thermomonas sp. HDW16 TaxID=2714945 RepID=UPI0014075795|nr:SPOR domain-containing protein [Thermomonas sp. HDW16]QIL21582.1 SPOR domain-containing protein [Thermomonas sp. HDW16]
MILRAAIVFLLVLNLGIAAWWLSGGNAATTPAAAPMPAGVPSLRLAAENAVTAPSITATATTPTPVPSTLASETTEEAIAPPIAVEQCLRFGPFADAATRDAARAALSSDGVSAVSRDTAARASRGWKVHIPAFASRAEANAMGEKIKAAGISDWYVMNQGDAANSIALGRYGSEESARRREAELKAKGIPAQAEAIGDNAAQAWLEARLPTNANRRALAAIAPSKSIDCASLR